MKVNLAYGQGYLPVEFPKDRTTVIAPTHAAGLKDERAAVIHALENPIGSNLAKQEEAGNSQTVKQGSDTPPQTNVVPVSSPVIAQPETKQSLSMLSESIDWSQVAACVSSKSNCICYGYNAQRLNIVPETCNAAIDYGWISSPKPKNKTL